MHYFAPACWKLVDLFNPFICQLGSAHLGRLKVSPFKAFLFLSASCCCCCCCCLQLWLQYCRFCFCRRRRCCRNCLSCSISSHAICTNENNTSRASTSKACCCSCQLALVCNSLDLQPARCAKAAKAMAMERAQAEARALCQQASSKLAEIGITNKCESTSSSSLFECRQ